MIGIDWGTTNFRAYRFRRGEVAERIAQGPGVLSVAAGGFAEALRGAVGAWLTDGERRVLMCGMVGSRQGWVEAAYLPCPTDPAGLAAAALGVAFEGAEVRILPGLSCGGAVPEVMRGEEVQIAGALGVVGADALICLPGSHSKWARVEGGRVVSFATHMTGEAFAALRGHTILGRLMLGEGDDDVSGAEEAFAEGVERAGAAGGLLHHLFGVRTLGLFGRLPEEKAACYLSGLLIGHEVRSAGVTGVVHLVGTARLCALYGAALRQLGVEAVVVGHDAAAAGLASIGEHVAWG